MIIYLNTHSPHTPCENKLTTAAPMAKPKTTVAALNNDGSSKSKANKIINTAITCKIIFNFPHTLAMRTVLNLYFKTAAMKINIASRIITITPIQRSG